MTHLPKKRCTDLQQLLYFQSHPCSYGSYWLFLLMVLFYIFKCIPNPPSFYSVGVGDQTNVFCQIKLVLVGPEDDCSHGPQIGNFCDSHYTDMDKSFVKFDCIKTSILQNMSSICLHLVYTFSFPLSLFTLFKANLLLNLCFIKMSKSRLKRPCSNMSWKLGFIEGLNMKGLIRKMTDIDRKWQKRETERQSETWKTDALDDCRLGTVSLHRHTWYSSIRLILSGAITMTKGYPPQV